MDWLLSIVQTQLNRIVSFMKPSPPFRWIELPDLAKESVVRALDISTRYSLRQCSKAQKILVDRCPVSIETIELISFEVIPHNVIEVSDRGKRLKKSSKHGLDLIDDFMRTIKSPSSTFKQVKIGFYYNIPENHQTLSTLLEKMKALRSNFKIKSEKFCWSCSVEFESYVPEFLERFDTDYLESFDLEHNSWSGNAISQKTVMKIIETEQWKKLKMLSVYVDQKETLISAPAIPIDNLLHVNQLYAEMEGINGKDIWTIIRNFRSIPRPVGSSFHIRHGMPIEKEDLLQHVATQSGNAIKLSYENTQFYMYPMKNKEHILVVMMKGVRTTDPDPEVIGFSGIQGVVCRKNHVVEDFVPHFAEDGLDEKIYDYKFLSNVPYFSEIQT